MLLLRYMRLSLLNCLHPELLALTRSYSTLNLKYSGRLLAPLLRTSYKLLTWLLLVKANHILRFTIRSNTPRNSVNNPAYRYGIGPSYLNSIATRLNDPNSLWLLWPLLLLLRMLLLMLRWLLLWVLHLHIMILRLYIRSPRNRVNNPSHLSYI